MDDKLGDLVRGQEVAMLARMTGLGATFAS
jgi:hypothetical protein